MTALLLRASASLWLIGYFTGCAKPTPPLPDPRIAVLEQQLTEATKRIVAIEESARNDRIWIAEVQSSANLARHGVETLQWSVAQNMKSHDQRLNLLADAQKLMLAEQGELTRLTDRIDSFLGRHLTNHANRQ